MFDTNDFMSTHCIHAQKNDHASLSRKRAERSISLRTKKSERQRKKTSRDYLALLKIGAPKKKGKELKLKYLMSYARLRAF